ncbi:MAG: cupin domain-containing protein [Actinobacteria bacterium]|nr:cupin domain-containing protein [Actinomycetota bacterium]
MDRFVVHQDSLEWVPADFPRAQMKVLYMDPRGGGQIMLIHFEPHCEMPGHSHISSDEAAYILEGELRQTLEDGGEETYRKGHFAFFPAGAAHGPFHTGDEGCTIISVFYGPLT